MSVDNSGGRSHPRTRVNCVVLQACREHHATLHPSASARPNLCSRLCSLTTPGSQLLLPGLVLRIATQYTTGVIQGFRHKGLRRLHATGSTQGIDPSHARRLRRILASLDAATEPRELDLPGYRLHALKGNMKGHWSITVSGNWRITFMFKGTDVDQVDYVDYH